LGDRSRLIDGAGAFEAVAVLVLIFGAVLSMGRFSKQMLPGSKQQAHSL
jgi:hypothetical protein